MVNHRRKIRVNNSVNDVDFLDFFYQSRINSMGPCVNTTDATCLLILLMFALLLALALLPGTLARGDKKTSHEHNATHTSSFGMFGGASETLGSALELPLTRGLGTSGTVWGAFPLTLGIGCAELVREVGTGGAGARRVTTINYTRFCCRYRSSQRYEGRRGWWKMWKMVVNVSSASSGPAPGLATDVGRRPFDGSPHFGVYFDRRPISARSNQDAFLLRFACSSVFSSLSHLQVATCSHRSDNQPRMRAGSRVQNTKMRRTPQIPLHRRWTTSLLVCRISPYLRCRVE